MRKGTQAILAGMAAICVVSSFFTGNVQAASEEKYPTQPIEILAPYAPGGGGDVISRVIADVGLKYLKQPILVVNKIGANGSIAAAEVIRSKPDGYKLVVLPNFFFATTVKTQKLPFNPDDLVPVVSLFEYKHGIAVKSDSPWKTLNELVEYAKTNPSKLKMSHAGRGTSQHLPIALIFKDAKIIEVPFQSGSERLPALLGGHIDAAGMTYEVIRGHLQANRLRLLVFFSDHRFSGSDVPSALELGYTDVAKFSTVVGLFVHKNTPEEIKKTLVDSFKKIYEDPQFKKALANFGDEPKFGGPEFLKKTIEDAKEVGIPLVKKLGLYVEQ